MWMLCVVLGSLHIQRQCWPVQNEARCYQEMRDWTLHSQAWSDRSKIPWRFMSVCLPPEWEREREGLEHSRGPHESPVLGQGQDRHAE